jgi:hypothetical protein
MGISPVLRTGVVKAPAGPAEQEIACLMELRRSSRLHFTPIVYLFVLGAAGLIVLAGGNRTRTFVLSGLFLYFWSQQAVLNWCRRLIIDDERIQLSGYFGKSVVINRRDVTECRYHRFLGNMRGSPDMFFFQIQDTNFHRISVWQYGWGGRRQELFRRLAQWLSESPCEMSDDVRERLTRLSDLPGP